MWVRGHSRSLKVVPFESLGTVSYSPSIVTVAVFVAVCEIFNVREWCDLENRVRVRSRSLVMAPFGKSITYEFLFTFHSSHMAISWRLRDIATYWLKNREIFIHLLYLAAPQGVTPSEFCENV